MGVGRHHGDRAVETLDSHEEGELCKLSCAKTAHG